MLRAEHGVVLITCALLAIGVVMVSSAGLTVGAESSVSLSGVLLGRHALLAALAMAALLVGSRVPVRSLGRLRLPALRVGPVPLPRSPVPWLVAGMAALLLCVYLPVIGREVNGARRWIDLGVMSFQPSEVAKWGMLFVLAAYAVQRAEVMHRFVHGWLVPMICVAVVCGLIVAEDLGTGALVGLVSFAILLAGGATLWHAAVPGALGAAALVAAVVTSPYRLDRMLAWLDPYRDPQGIGYHVIQSMTTVHGGGLAGRGLGNGVQKFGYLPEDTTDFIFAVICEEIGLVGAAVVVALFGCLLVCGWSIIRRSRDPFCRLLGLGIVVTTGLQALINLAVVTGLAPTKGIALPLVSAGGTGWVLTAFCLGLLVSVGREARPAADGTASTVCLVR
jgi:cell division protein FtsW